MHQFEFEDLPRRRGSHVFVSTGKLKMALARDRMRRTFGRFAFFGSAPKEIIVIAFHHTGPPESHM